MAVPEPPPVPFALRVGVTGHRTLRGDGEAVGRAVESILTTIREAAAALAWPDPCRLILVSSLAEGADQLVARAGLSLGYELAVALPFPAAAFRLDFAPESDAERRFDALLGEARSVLELDGDRGSDARPAPSGIASASAAYEAAGRVVLGHADLLLALVDDDHAGSRGGAAQMLREALAEDIPAAVIPPSNPAAARLNLCERGNVRCVEGLDEIPRCLVRIIAPERSEEALHGPWAERHVLSQRRQHATFLAEGRLARRTRWADVGRLWGRIWGLATSRLKPPSKARDLVPYPPDAAGASPSLPSRIESWFGDHYRWVDWLAGRYASLYRSTFLVVYALGAMAVLLALGSAVAERGSQALAQAFTIAELGCLVLVMVLVLLARRGTWRAKSVNYRVLAEELRSMRYLAPLALAPPLGRPLPYVAEEGDLRASWITWHFRAVLRGAGLVHASFEPAYLAACHRLLRDEWVLEQADYHHRNETLMARIHRVLGTAALVAALGAVAACVLHLLHVGSSAWLVLFAAGLPALAAALHGIATQAEAERIEKRSASMARWLHGEHAALADPLVSLDEPPSAPLRRAALAVAREMLEEVTDWQHLNRAGDVRMV
jgi:hypothetical protein